MSVLKTNYNRLYCSFVNLIMMIIVIYYLILQFSFVISNSVVSSLVSNSNSKFSQTCPNIGLGSEYYDLSLVTAEVNLQYCSIVQIGEGFCSMFIEFRTKPDCEEVSTYNTVELFLGICQCSTLSDWQLCSNNLANERANDCLLRKDDLAGLYSSARVHRRLCDVTNIPKWNDACDCSKKFAGQPLYPVTGFLTCFRSPLPESICYPRSVCGTARCTPKTLASTNPVHTVKCNYACRGHMPFCEEIGPVTTAPRLVKSNWSTWHSTNCSICGEKHKVEEAVCIDNDKKNAFDCIGPGLKCCPENASNCRCEVNTYTTALKVTRYKKPCSLPMHHSSQQHIRSLWDKFRSDEKSKINSTENNYKSNGQNSLFKPPGGSESPRKNLNLGTNNTEISYKNDNLKLVPPKMQELEVKTKSGPDKNTVSPNQYRDYNNEEIFKQNVTHPKERITVYLQNKPGGSELSNKDNFTTPHSKEGSSKFDGNRKSKISEKVHIDTQPMIPGKEDEDLSENQPNNIHKLELKHETGQNTDNKSSEKSYSELKGYPNCQTDSEENYKNFTVVQNLFNIPKVPDEVLKAGEDRQNKINSSEEASRDIGSESMDFDNHNDGNKTKVSMCNQYVFSNKRINELHPFLISRKLGNRMKGKNVEMWSMNTDTLPKPNVTRSPSVEENHASRNKIIGSKDKLILEKAKILEELWKKTEGMKI